MLFVDLSVNYEPISQNLAQAIFRSYLNVGKNFEKLNSILQKLDHLTCYKILELV